MPRLVTLRKHHFLQLTVAGSPLFDVPLQAGKVRLRVESGWTLQLRVKFSSFERCCCGETGRQPSRAYGFC